MTHPAMMPPTQKEPHDSLLWLLENRVGSRADTTIYLADPTTAVLVLAYRPGHDLGLVLRAVVLIDVRWGYPTGDSFCGRVGAAIDPGADTTVRDLPLPAHFPAWMEWDEARPWRPGGAVAARWVNEHPYNATHVMLDRPRGAAGDYHRGRLIPIWDLADLPPRR